MSLMRIHTAHVFHESKGCVNAGNSLRDVCWEMSNECQVNVLGGLASKQENLPPS